MSMSSALNNAVSGLTASSRMAEIISSNTANAMTEGYARRELSLSSETLGGDGGGVRILGVNRVVNESLLQDRRIADAEAANTTARTDFYSRFESALGDPETQGSLSSLMSELEGSLIEAASMPDSTARLTTAVNAAGNVADKLNTIADDLQQVRLDADHSIADQVSTLNDTLQKIEVLNRTITSEISVGNDAAGLMDQRQALVDRIAEIVPVRTVARDNNQIALYTTGGAILLDGSASEVGFTQSGVMNADMTIESGALSGLTLNGHPISSSDDGAFGGGTLGAAFAVRDELAPAAQEQLDAVARNLIERFADPSVDSTLASGDAGLFTDGGGAFDPANETGLAGRIQINAIVDPAQGGEVWHLRDGIGATSEGAVGDASLLNALSGALSEAFTPASGGFGSALRSASGLVADLLSSASAKRQSSELDQSYAVARQETLTELTLADGVDTDYEMQMLLKVQQAYAANAKVITAIDEMMQRVLEM
ncbi:MAG: flagellar hook-associated protein FlgK [Paenirhodobacter sp.]|uniref:flagellar hook-associated protein FlgK n=1 Tax=Paenirhodobacter sp. TaxID=1965326 RepID=UPI003D0F7C76